VLALASLLLGFIVLVSISIVLHEPPPVPPAGLMPEIPDGFVPVAEV